MLKKERMDKYELELLEAVDSAIELERAENFKSEILDAKLAAKNYLQKANVIQYPLK